MASTAARVIPGRNNDRRKSDGTNRTVHRQRRALLGMTSALIVKGFSALTVLGSIRLALGYLGSERFAIWTMISSLLGMLTFADLGIANGLTSAISRCVATGDRPQIQRLTSSAFFLLLTVSGALVAIYCVGFPYLDWQRIFNISSPTLSKECGLAVTVCFLLFAVNLPLGITQRVQSGFQENHVSNIFIVPGNLFSIAGIYVSMRMNLGLCWLCGFLMSGPVISSLANGFYTFGIKRRWAFPRLRFVSPGSVRQVAGVGLGFALLQVIAVAGSQTDSLVLAHVLGPLAVTLYVVPTRLYQFLPSLLNVTLANLWPAYADAIACGDRRWARTVLLKSVWMSVCLNGAAGLVLLTFGNLIVRNWIGHSLKVPVSLWLALTIYIWVNAATSPLSSFLNGLQIVTPQVAFQLPGLALNVILSIVLTQWIGISGVVWGTIIYQILAVLIPGFWLAYGGLNRDWQAKAVKAHA